MWEDEPKCDRCGLLVTPEDFPTCSTCLWLEEERERQLDWLRGVAGD